MTQSSGDGPMAVALVLTILVVAAALGSWVLFTGLLVLVLVALLATLSR